jgi:signal transduction histidine kinase
VVDNGGGPSSTRGAGHGIGLSNTEARLKVLHGALARVIAGPGSSGGFEVVVELPAKESP